MRCKRLAGGVPNPLVVEYIYSYRWHRFIVYTTNMLPIPPPFLHFTQFAPHAAHVFFLFWSRHRWKIAFGERCANGLWPKRWSRYQQVESLFFPTAILSDFVLLQLRFATTKLAGQNGQCITVHANRCQKAPELINAKMQKKNPRYECSPLPRKILNPPSQCK